MRGHRPACALLAATLILSGCLGTPKLMTPGAQGVTFQLWGDPGQPPTLMQADRLEQVLDDSQDASGHRKTGFEHLRFEALRVRKPFDDGVLYLLSPRGEYLKDAADLVVLEGPVRISGTLGGEPFIGVGERAVLHRDSNQVELLGDESPGADQDPRRLAVVLTHGSAARSRHFLFDDFAAPSSSGKPGVTKRQLHMSTTPYSFMQAADAPAVALALAALPHPLVVPEPVVEMK